ncbi:hypothetical protein FWF74_03680 [Candidatus Saccharibacteria bacterium]|nr:hypothetical protein [Candidatus Saccharibacteria bacterium]MCL1962875.1 hypothetical protein [Candidatus Saccharibacteria bacterium]
MAAGERYINAKGVGRFDVRCDRMEGCQSRNITRFGEIGCKFAMASAALGTREEFRGAAVDATILKFPKKRGWLPREVVDMKDSDLMCYHMAGANVPPEEEQPEK